jgi:serine/threonine protein kinase
MCGVCVCVVWCVCVCVFEPGGGGGGVVCVCPFFVAPCVVSWRSALTHSRPPMVTFVWLVLFWSQAKIVDLDLKIIECTNSTDHEILLAKKTGYLSAIDKLRRLETRSAVGEAEGTAASALPSNLSDRMTLIFKHELLGMQEISSGQFGLVFKATYKGTTVIVKQPKHPQSDSQLAECRLLGVIPRHPNVLPMLGVCVEATHLLLVCPFMPNGSLQDMLNSPDRRRYLADAGHLRIIFSDICKGVGHLHSNNILHRDIAPRNALLDLYMRAVVADFGMSRQVDTGDAQYVMLSDSQVPARWMAPESLSRREFTPKSDVWSLGVVLWQCLTFRIPYADFDTMHVMIGLSQGTLALPLDELGPLGDEWRPVLAACLNPRAFQRPTVAQLIAYMEGDVTALPSPFPVEASEYVVCEQSSRSPSPDVFGQPVRTFGQGLLNAPHGIFWTLDPTSKVPMLLICDSDNKRVCALTAMDGSLMHTLGEGVLDLPYAVVCTHNDDAVAAGKRVFVSDIAVHAVVVFAWQGGVPLARIDDQFNEPCGLALSSDHLWVADCKHHQVITFGFFFLPLRSLLSCCAAFKSLSGVSSIGDILCCVSFVQSFVRAGQTISRRYARIGGILGHRGQKRRSSTRQFSVSGRGGHLRQCRRGGGGRGWPCSKTGCQWQKFMGLGQQRTRTGAISQSERSRRSVSAVVCRDRLQKPSGTSAQFDGWHSGQLLWKRRNYPG